MRFSQLGGFDIGRRETAEILERWVSGQSEALAGEGPAGVLDTRHSESNAVFREGLELYESGRIAEALARWRQGLELNPDNYLIRKQIWAVENPERFYEGDVDYNWQREQCRPGQSGSAPFSSPCSPFRSPGFMSPISLHRDGRQMHRHFTRL